MEKEQVILTITNEMSNNLTNYQLELLKNVLIIQFKNIEITVLTDEIKKKEEQSEQILSEWLFFLYFNHQKNQFYFPVSQ